MTTVINGLGRLKDLLEDELPKIEAKKQIAQENGAEVALIDDLIAELRMAIAEAAVEEAKREIEEAEDEAKRIERGKGKKGSPADGGPGDPEPSGPDEGNDSSGDNGPGGGDGGGESDATGSGGLPIGPHASGSAPGQVSIPSSQCIYVRSDRTVWGWNRFDQAWHPHEFSSPILTITTVGGGLLVVAEHSAVLFDCSMAEWLTPLETTEDLLAGDAVGTTPELMAVGSTPSSSGEMPGGMSPSTPSGSDVGEDPTTGAHFGGSEPIPDVTDILGLVAGANVPPMPSPDELTSGPEPPFSPPGFDEPEPDGPSDDDPAEPDDEDN
ncbi:hypothetical protein ACFQE8_03205 [Salinirubellus sp. GCM10025818]|uniref:hypothetical protein n=1 Tax=Salinirubellus TaxID=2162630 RepID=UPI0030D19E7D